MDRKTNNIANNTSNFINININKNNELGKTLNNSSLSNKHIYGLISGIKTSSFTKKTLGELLNEDKPVVMVNGERHRIKQRELDYLKDIASKDLKIPIVLQVDSNLNEGTIKIEGTEEVNVISKILNKEINKFEENNLLYIYKPELRVVRKKLPTTTTYLFRMGID
ncbi:DUF61 family protein [Methanococcus voltae]|uniref:UPF0216 protein J3E07_001398 n=2 Tax=Methanococcus voltae TaxID=2188 RepID=A0A8J7URM7_METVO|nr:uncharacterized protein (UPF0216 family) [Methanococcus voltae]MBP2201958.1 uncharacterized protein (UPF0216 family) [Methanococcus voltae]MCS3922122.1 uncharacterized protein (UPF0216 family) [Methanococcus voltae PS]